VDRYRLVVVALVVALVAALVVAGRQARTAADAWAKYEHTNQLLDNACLTLAAYSGGPVFDTLTSCYGLTP
jgi:hypothetical protein